MQLPLILVDCGLECDLRRKLTNYIDGIEVIFLGDGLIEIYVVT